MTGKMNSTTDSSEPAGNIGKKDIINLIENMTDDPEELTQILKAVNYNLTDRGSLRSYTALYRRMKNAEDFIDEAVDILTNEDSRDRVLRAIVDEGRYDNYSVKNGHLSLYIESRR